MGPLSRGYGNTSILDFKSYSTFTRESSSVYINREYRSSQLWNIQDHKDCEEKQSYPNPTYGMITEKHPAADTVIQFHSWEEGNGQTHNAFNRGDDQGKRR